jgi:hypothetical protein
VGMWAMVEARVPYMGNAAQLEVGQVKVCALLGDGVFRI